MFLFRIFIIGVMFFSVQAIASAADSNNFIVFEVVTAKFVFDNRTVKRASIMNHRDGTFSGLYVELKPYGAKELEKMTKGAQGKIANVILNDKIISTSTIGSALGSNLLISGISKEQARKMLEELWANEKM